MVLSGQLGHTASGWRQMKAQLRKVELKAPKTFYPDSRLLFDPSCKPVNQREGFEMWADYDRQVIIVNDAIIPFSEVSHFYEARVQPPPPAPVEPTVTCEKCGRSFEGRKAYGGHIPHCKGQ